MIGNRVVVGAELEKDVYLRIEPHLVDIPKEQLGYALQVATCELELFATALDAGPTGRHRATIRMLGHEWAARRWPLDSLLALIGKVAEAITGVLLSSHPADAIAHTLAAVADVSHQCLAEVSIGFAEPGKAWQRRGAPAQAALALLRGKEPAEEPNLPIAAAYGVLAFRAADDSAENYERAAAWLAAQTSDGVLSLVCGHGGYVLVPAHDITFATRFARLVQARLPAETWTAVSWRLTAEIPEGRAEAADVLTAALASQLPPGVHELGDVLVEYAVVRHPEVLKLLAKRIDPVVHNPVLLETLNAFRVADGNRTKAAAALIIHRSTLDYRLAQIERLTGHTPTSARALQILSAALTAHTVSRSRLPDVAAWDG